MDAPRVLEVLDALPDEQQWEFFQHLDRVADPDHALKLTTTDQPPDLGGEIGPLPVVQRAPEGQVVVVLVDESRDMLAPAHDHTLAAWATALAFAVSPNTYVGVSTTLRTCSSLEQVCAGWLGGGRNNHLLAENRYAPLTISNTDPPTYWRNLWVTLSSRGAALWSPGMQPYHLPLGDTLAHRLLRCEGTSLSLRTSRT